MLRAYVGIVSRWGLELLCAEHPQSVEFLQRRVLREQGRVAGIWSVLPDEAVTAIQTPLSIGQLREALAALQLHSHDCGLLPPCDIVDPAPNIGPTPIP